MESSDFAAYVSKLFGGLENTAITDSGFKAEQKGALVYVFHNHPTVICDIPDILEVIRSRKAQRIIFVSLSDFTEAVKTLCMNKEHQAELIDGAHVLLMAEKAGLLPDEQTAQQRAEEEINQTVVTLTKFKESAFNRNKVKGYMVCGIVASLWPLVTGFKFYYPVIAAVCFALAIYTYRKGQHSKETQDIGIS